MHFIFPPLTTFSINSHLLLRDFGFLVSSSLPYSCFVRLWHSHSRSQSHSHAHSGKTNSIVDLIDFNGSWTAQRMWKVLTKSNVTRLLLFYFPHECASVRVYECTSVCVCVTLTFLRFFIIFLSTWSLHTFWWGWRRFRIICSVVEHFHFHCHFRFRWFVAAGVWQDVAA